MAQTYNNAIELQQGFKFTEPIVSDDRQYVATLNDVLTIEGLIPNLPIHIADIDVWVEWNGQDKADINNFVERLKSLKDSISNNTTAIAALTSGTQYAIPQTGNTPVNEPAPTQNGIYTVKTKGVTYTNFGNIAVPNVTGFEYKIQVSGIGVSPVYALLETDLNITFDATPTSGSTNAVTGNGVFDGLALKADKTNEIYYRVGKNRFNINSSDIQPDATINGSGVIVANSFSINVTHKIPIKLGETLIANFSTSNVRSALYDKNDNPVFISALSSTSLAYVAGAEYALFSYYQSAVNPQIELTSITTFEPYVEIRTKDVKESADANYLEFINYKTSNDIDVAKKITPSVITSKQIFDKNTSPYLAGKFVNTGGNISTNSLYNVIKFPLVENQDIYLSNFVTNNPFSVAYYNISDVLLSNEQKSGNGNTFKGVASCSYILVTILITDIPIAIASYGTVAISYEDYNIAFDNKYVQKSDKYIADLLDVKSNVPINSKALNEGLNTLDVDGKLDKVIGNQLFNKNTTSEAVLSGSSPYNTDTFGEDSILTDAWSTGFNFGSWKIIYQVGSFLSPKIYITEANPTIRTNVPSNVYQRIFYFNSSNQITNIVSSTTTATWVSGTAYVRVMFEPSFINSLMINFGSTLLTYQDYTENKPVKDLQKQNYIENVVAVLPDKLYFVKDFQSCIYYENILKKNLDDGISVLFNQGIDYKRLNQFNFSTAVTNQTLQSQISIALQKGEIKNMTYDVVDKTTNNAKALPIMYIGHSFLDIGTWARETTTLLEADGIVVEEVGTQTKNGLTSECWSGGNINSIFLTTSLGTAKLVTASPTVIPQNGFQNLGGQLLQGVLYLDDNGNQRVVRGGGNGLVRVINAGTTSTDFTGFPTSGNLTKVAGQTSLAGDNVIAYTSPVDAFVNPYFNSSGVFDIANYMTLFNLTTPKVAVIMTTFNELTTWDTDANIQALVDRYKETADKLKTAFPLVKVIFTIEPYAPLYGNSDFNGRKSTFLRLVQKMIEQIERDVSYNAFTYIAPAYAFFDLINGYGNTNPVPCNRFPTLTEVGTGDGVHPLFMEQIADCLYQVISNKI
jgi:hypothetical protein